MPDSTVTLILPRAVYDALEQRARQHHRRVEEEATLALAAAIGADAELPSDIAVALNALAALDDAALQRVSRSRPSVEDGVLLDALLDARRRGQLGPDGERALAEVVDRHDRVLALRAEAVALLAQRGVDMRERVARA